MEEKESPIRVLHILHSMNRGGAENVLMNYYRNIDREKVQFDFLLTDQGKGLFEDEILQLGGRVYKVPLLTMTNPWPYLKAVKTFFKEHKEYKIVHSHTSSKSVFPLWIAKRCGVPVRCCHSHINKTEPGIGGYMRDVLKPFLKVVATDYMSCGNQASVWLYGKKTFDEGKVNLMRNVIETEKFVYNVQIRKEYRDKFEISDDTIVIGHTARFNLQKNHLFDVEILKGIKMMGENVKLMLVGTGELKESIVQKAKELNVLDDVIFTGVVSNVYDYEQAMDAFILPSFKEGLPLSIIEAQVSGLPCFTSKGNVSSECSVTDLVQYIPLEAGAKVWAEKIVEATKLERRDRQAEVIAAGYDAKTSAKWLEEFYIQKYNELVNA